jgi:2-dehydropantoate 2-reductase
MKFAVLGAGAIGAYVGAALSRGGSDVTLIARGEHLRALQENGVQVTSPKGDFHAHPVATDDFAALGEADVVFVGLKAHSLPALATEIASVLTPGAAVIAAQNGVPWWYFQSHPGPLANTVLESVDPGGVIGLAIPPEAVIGCVIYSSTEIVAPGIIRHIEGTRFPIGEPNGERSDRCAEISAAFAAGGLRCSVESRIRDHIWLKLIGNAAFNPVSALTGATLGEMGEEPETVQLLRAILEECTLVANRLGIELPVSIDRRLEAGIAVGDHKTSMLQDLEAGKPLELDCMTGAVIELAEMLNIPVPHTLAVNACAKLLDKVRRTAVLAAA